MSSPPTDAKGVPLVEGQFVCYTVSERGSALQFGHIKKVNVKTQQRYVFNRQTNQREVELYDEVRITVFITDAFGKPKMQQEWDSTAPNPDNLARGGNGFGKHVDTDRQCVSGAIHYYSDKFLVLT